MRKIAFITMVTLALAVFGYMVASAEIEAGPNFEGSVNSGTATIESPVVGEVELLEAPPILTDQKKAVLEYWLEHTHLPGPPKQKIQNSNILSTPPAAGTESIISSDPLQQLLNPLLPGDFSLMRVVGYGSKIPDNYRSNIMEHSVAASGRAVFATGNWFAARSWSNGGSWQFINPFSGFPSFCCDQGSIYDESRDRFYWLRMGIPGTNPGTGNYENEFKLSVSTQNAFGSSYWTYSFKPVNTNGTWTNEWWDYSHMQLGADYLYIAWNMFNNLNQWTRTVVLRLPLDALASGAGFSYNYYAQSEWFTLVPVQGAYHTMYFASNWPTTSPYNRIRIWRWREDSGPLSYWTRDIPAWSDTGFFCGDGTGNWLGRANDRVLTGALYSISMPGIDNPEIPGRKVLGWWWNSAAHDSFPYPYIEAAAFYEDTISLVEGYRGRPYVYGSWCFAYPSVASNKRGDLAMVLHTSYGVAGNYPSVAASIADDNYQAPPGWDIDLVRSSSSNPSDNKWGDFNTCRQYAPAEELWIGGSHVLPIAGQGTCCSSSAPVYFVFGRERDTNSFTRWKNK